MNDEGQEEVANKESNCSRSKDGHSEKEVFSFYELSEPCAVCRQRPAVRTALNGMREHTADVQMTRVNSRKTGVYQFLN